MKKLHYNLAFAIGQSCGCSDSLRRAGLQHLTFPGDWTAPLYGKPRHSFLDDDLCERTDILCDGCADFFKAEHFFPQGTVSNTGKDIYINRKTRYIFNHDFAAGADFAAELPKIVAKYARRKERLFELIAKSPRVLAVRMDIPGGEYPTALEACRYARRRLNERFAPAKVDILLVSYAPGVPFEQRRFEQVEDGFYRLSFDYLNRKRDLPNQPDLSLTSAALAELFSVDDYRTKEEKRDFARRLRKKKIQRFKDRLARLTARLPHLRTRYDLAFGLGITRDCSEALRRAGLQKLSFPYDWLTIPSDDPAAVRQDLLQRVKDICEGFSSWFGRDDFRAAKCLSEFEAGKDQYLDGRHNLLFYHDFLAGVPFGEQIDGVCEKYRRRCARLLSLIGSSRRILVLYVERPGLADRIPDAVLRDAQGLLDRRFPDRQFDFCLLSYEKGLAFEKRKVEQLGRGLTRVTFDYRDYTPGKRPHQIDLGITGGFLSRLFKVRDYRTAAEKRAYEEQKWARRCQNAGVPNRAAYHRAQVSAIVHGRYNLAADLVARLRRKKFEQIVILGFNCEAAFRFVCKWDFLDSSLLAWANTLDMEHLIAGLERFDGIGAGEMAFHLPTRMWYCKNAGIYFHGKMRAIAGAPEPTAAELDADLADLRSRIAHLKEKFLSYAGNEKSTLFVYKIGSPDAARPDLGDRLDALQAALRKLGARNALLLVVCERAMLGRMPPAPGRLFRAVKKYNPGNDVTSRRKGDPAGWKRIFSEFAPARVLKRTHKFKYE